MGAPVGNENARKHGAYSAQNPSQARAQKARLLRQLRLRSSDLDGVGRALLDTHARSIAKVHALDAWYDRHGFIDDDGNVAPSARFYFVALNAAARTARALGDHLKARAAGDADGLEELIAQGAEIRRLRGLDGGAS